MRRFLIACFLLGVGFLGEFAVRQASDQFWDVDKCLDRGGAYNYDKDTCEYD